MKNILAVAAPSAWLVSGSRLAACAAAWCSVHCALTPFLALAAPALALSEGVERMVWAATALVGAVMLGLGPARRKTAVILVFAAGSALWGASLAGWLEPAPETVTSAGGSLLLAVSLLWSARVCRTDACAVCAEEDRGSRNG